MGNTPYGHSFIITELLAWVQGRMGLEALHDRVHPTTTTLEGKTFTANIVQRYGCYQPTQMGNTPYGHSIIITELLTWVQGRMGLEALHDRVQTTTTTLDGKTFTANIVQTTTTTSDGKTFTANKVQRHGCYQPTPMGNPAYGHSIKEIHVFQPLLPKKGTFFSHIHLKNACFSATSAQKTHVFQPLPPEKCTFFSHFHLKNTRFSATST
jgi:hypothetical protein